MSFTKHDPPLPKKLIPYSAPKCGKHIPTIDPATLLPHQRQLLWAGIKHKNPALAELLKNDETIALLKTVFDAKVIFTEEEATYYYMESQHD